MKTKLIKIDNDWALPLDQTILSQLDFGPDTELTLTVEGGKLIVASSNATQSARIKSASERINQKYTEAFRRLADE